MTDARFDELASRVDAVGRVLMHLIADLEQRELLDGERFCTGIQRYAEGRQKEPSLQASAQVMKAIADEIDDARRNRSAALRH